MRSALLMAVAAATVLPACAHDTPPPAQPAVAVADVTIPAAPQADASAPAPPLPAAEVAPPAPPLVTTDAEGLVAAPAGPRPARVAMTGSAALVWETTPAPKTSGTTGRDRVVTRFVVEDGATGKVVAERPEAVMASRTSLFHLRERKLRSYGCDCSRSSADQSDPSWFLPADLHEVVIESLDPRPQVIAPMSWVLQRKPRCEGNEAVPWARIDLVTMAGPYLSFTFDYTLESCGAAHPIGSASHQVQDLDGGRFNKLSEPAGLRATLRPVAEQLLAGSCGNGGTIEDDVGAVGLRYDRAGDLVAEYGFTSFTHWACYHGVLHLRVGAYELPPEVAPHGRLPAWLAAWLVDHPASGVSVIAAGGEDRARKRFEALPRKPRPVAAHAADDG